MRQKQRRSGAETLHVIDRHTPAVAPTAWEDLLGRLRSITWRRIGVAVETALCVVACRRPEPKSDHPLRIDLSGCNFSKLRLPGANLAGVRLAHVNLDGADLSFADLRGADLTCASLRHARLAGADLRQAVLDEADFTGADLTLTAMDPYPIPKTATPDAHSNHTLHSTGAGQQPREPSWHDFGLPVAKNVSTLLISAFLVTFRRPTLSTCENGTITVIRLLLIRSR